MCLVFLWPIVVSEAGAMAASSPISVLSWAVGGWVNGRNDVTDRRRLVLNVLYARTIGVRR